MQVSIAYWLEWLLVLGIFWLAANVLLAMFFRRVVPTNAVHIVQMGRSTISYGTGQAAGNVYYRWPTWIPRFGRRVIVLPVSVFDLQLQNYAAYDKGRVPFLIDVLAFFRIDDPRIAAQRVSTIEELQQQLGGILRGASRSILARAPIEEILEKRAEYGQEFTDATKDQLKAWGVVNVKNIELMDIRDAEKSQVIANIMAIKQSTIAKESRIQVALNGQAAQQAEIDAQRAVYVRQQEAEEAVGVRTAAKTQQVGIAGQQAEQAIKEAERGTAEKAMAVLNVQKVRAAEIEREAQVVRADQDRKMAVIAAEAEKQKLTTVAEGTLAQQKLLAEGIEAQGKAKGAAETAVLMAPVTAQTALAKEIGENKGYQEYLVTIRRIEADQAVGIQQADALKAANIKVIANAGNVIDGVKSTMDLFSAKGGLQVGAALEALANTETGAAVIDAVTKGGNGATKHQ